MSSDRDRSNSKIFRAGSVPEFVSEERACDRSYGHVIDLGDSRLRYRRSGWLPVDWNPGSALREREFFAWISIGRGRVGALCIRQYRGDPFLGNLEFFDLMDSVSQEKSDLATVVFNAWEYVGNDLFSYGDVLEFQTVWTEPHLCPPKLWARASSALIEAECGGYSVLILKAFPLEYEGKGDDLVDVGLERRQKAMRRHYASVLGVRPFPQDDEWMYRIHPRLVGIVEQPS